MKIIFHHDNTERSSGESYVKVGKTFGGRFLELAYEKLPDGTTYVFHAMNAREHQKKRYRRRK